MCRDVYKCADAVTVFLFFPFSLHDEHEAKFMDDKWHSSRKTPPPPPVCWRAGRTSARYHSSHADDISMRKAC